jgi:Glycine zipper 2TM domain
MLRTGRLLNRLRSKIMRNIILTLAAATAALTVPAAASAQSYGNRGYAVPQDCQQSVNNNRLAGGVVGAVAGAVLGNQLAARNARPEGQVLGAVVGAVAGQAIAKGRLACDDAAYNGGYQPRRESQYRPQGYGYSNYDPRFDNRRHNNSYAYQTSYTPPRHVRQECGWGEAALRRPDGLYERQQVWMCRDHRGNWQVQN